MSSSDIETLSAALAAECDRAVRVEAELALARAKAADDAATITRQNLEIAKLKQQIYGGAAPARCRLYRSAVTSRYRHAAPSADTHGQRSGRCQDWLRSGASIDRRPTGAVRRGSCAWEISTGRSPLLWNEELGAPDSRITQRRSSRPPTAQLPWSPWTGTGGHHRPETPVAMLRRTQTGVRTFNRRYWKWPLWPGYLAPR